MTVPPGDGHQDHGGCDHRAGDQICEGSYQVSEGGHDLGNDLIEISWNLLWIRLKKRLSLWMRSRRIWTIFKS